MNGILKVICENMKGVGKEYGAPNLLRICFLAMGIRMPDGGETTTDGETIEEAATVVATTANAQGYETIGDEEEVERCQCHRCLELDDKIGKKA
jgi:hypothetical protein